jgi:hypothetical protein
MQCAAGLARVMADYSNSIAQTRQITRFTLVPCGISSSLTLRHAAACEAGAFVVF